MPFYFCFFVFFAVVGTIGAVAGVKVSQTHSPLGKMIRSKTPRVSAAADLAQIYALIGAALLTPAAVLGGNVFYIILQGFLVATIPAYWLPRISRVFTNQRVQGVRAFLMFLTIIYALYLASSGQIKPFEILAWIGLEGIALGYLYENDNTTKRPLTLFVGGTALVVSASLGFFLDPGARAAHVVWGVLNMFFAFESWRWWQSLRH